VTDAGLKELAALKGLQKLDLRRTQVTDAGVAELQEALPTLTIRWNAIKPFHLPELPIFVIAIVLLVIGGLYSGFQRRRSR
jgi:hypothetical protein